MSLSMDEWTYASRYAIRAKEVLAKNIATVSPGAFTKKYYFARILLPNLLNFYFNFLERKELNIPIHTSICNRL